MNAVVVLSLFALILILAFALLTALPAARDAQVVAKPLLTRREREALLEMERTFPQFRVYPQVAMGALMQVGTGPSPAARTALRNRFDRKIVDFVLEDRATGEVFALVELDDRTHDAAKDRRRDALTRAAGYRTFRLPAGRKIELQALRAVLADPFA
jgi:hypothetical protein